MVVSTEEEQVTRPHAGIVGPVVCSPHPVAEPIHLIIRGHRRHQPKATGTLREDVVSVADHIGKWVPIQVGQNLLESVLITALILTADVGQVSQPEGLGFLRRG